MEEIAEAGKAETGTEIPREARGPGRTLLYIVIWPAVWVLSVVSVLAFLISYPFMEAQTLFQQRRHALGWTILLAGCAAELTILGLTIFLVMRPR